MRDRDRQTDKRTDRQTNGQTDRQKHRHRERERLRQRQRETEREINTRDVCGVSLPQHAWPCWEEPFRVIIKSWTKTDAKRKRL